MWHVGKMGVSNSQPWCGRRGHSEKGQPASPRGVGIGSSRVRPGPRNRPSQGRRVLRAAFAAPSSREQACTPTHRDEGLGAAETDSCEGCQGRGVPVAAAWSVVVMRERGAGTWLSQRCFRANVRRAQTWVDRIFDIMSTESEQTALWGSTHG